MCGALQYWLCHVTFATPPLELFAPKGDNMHPGPDNRSFSAGIWMFGQFVDRFASDGYGPAVSMPEAIRSAAKVGGIESLDLNFPFWGTKHL